jgi:hypothetical protein
MFLRNITPPPSGLKSISSKKPAEAGYRLDFAGYLPEDFTIYNDRLKILEPKTILPFLGKTENVQIGVFLIPNTVVLEVLSEVTEFNIHELISSGSSQSLK